LFLVLGAIALVYAFLAALATVADPDLGWHLATGRWLAQHHRVFTTDVFSYTIPGASAIYPPFGGLVLYGIDLLGGFALLSWLSALACGATVALLLRRGSAVTAAIAILAVPFIAYRSVPRAELFAIVLFAAYLSLLWENYQTNRARLWLFPVLMLIWVNVHFSFFSGLALMVAFGGMDILELPFSDTRFRALQRLKREIPWFLATVIATLANPWGWKLYPALFDYTRVLHSLYINEWASLNWNWTNPLVSFSLRNTSDIFHVLLVFTVMAIAVAFLQRQLGPAILLLAAIYEAARHVRMIEMASCVAVVVGGSVVYSLVMWIGSRIPSGRARLIAATVAAGIFATVAIVRSADVLTNYHYLTERNLSTFGAGLSPWFPRRAAEFIQNENLPGEVLNTFNEGGYLIWKLGPQRRDYIDGRAAPFGRAFSQHGGDLLSTTLDTSLWQQEVEKYGINTIIFPLTLDEISLERLRYDCKSVEWRPVYLDEVSIVLVRRKPETEDLIRRFEVDCATAPIPREQLPISAAAFNSWSNAARVLSALGRNAEALSAIDKAVEIAPDSAHAHWYRGQILAALQRTYAAEQEYEKALALAHREVTPWGSLPGFQAAVWSSLAAVYNRDERTEETIQALQAVIRLSSDPSTKIEAMANLGALYLTVGQLSEAEKEWVAALSLAPDESPIWFSLADLYERNGRLAAAVHARQQGISLSSDASTKADGLVKLARLYLMGRQPREALQTLDQAVAAAPPQLLGETKGPNFNFNVTQERAAAWMALGDLKQAISFEEQAVRLDPDAADAWSHLAKLYQREGRLADQKRAEERGGAIVTDNRKF
jgi:tetratricopeptide (TPR) repeat protein